MRTINMAILKSISENEKGIKLEDKLFKLYGVGPSGYIDFFKRHFLNKLAYFKIIDGADTYIYELSTDICMKMENNCEDMAKSVYEFLKDYKGVDNM